ncbi:hypothetical protein M5D96_006640 [Drosophila gunungcola]|uniref:Secreted protein n=1 Tax=Drosophila gunungcola TaxID=103775 RepID=A0A9Q0BQ79_9MUSC|nr:hypothetical protein M5D96_006640 [Drosophila gunungcola]
MWPRHAASWMSWSGCWLTVTIQQHAMAKNKRVAEWSCQNPKPQTIKQNCKLDVI